VQVVQNYDQGLNLRRINQERCHGVKEAKSGLFRTIKGWRDFQVGQFASQRRNDFGDVGSTWTHFRAQLFGVSLLNVSPDWIYPGSIRRRSFFLVAPSPQDLGTNSLGMGCQVLRNPSLADAGLPYQHGYMPPT
jgi:hypothetical protein